MTGGEGLIGEVHKISFAVIYGIPEIAFQLVLTAAGLHGRDHSITGFRIVDGDQ